MNMDVRLNELDSEIKKIQSEQSRIQGRKELLNEELSRKIHELQELGIEFTSREDLKAKASEIEDVLETSLDALERKLDTYNNIKMNTNIKDI